MKNVLNALPALIILILITGCASSSAPKTNGSYSTGGELMIKTKISNERTLKNYSEAQKKSDDIAKQHNNPLLDGDLIFGSGLVGSTVFFVQNGVWLNPGNFLDKASLGMFALNFLSGTGMRHHPWTYTYFFHQSADCNERKCVEDNLEAFSADMMRAYFNHPSARFKESSLMSLEYARANMLLDRFAVYAQFENPESERNPKWRLLNATNLKRMHNKPTPMWGNVEPTKFQDAIGLPGLNYEQTAELLLDISASHPSILVFIGIDRTRKDNQQPCFGGFFLQEGTILPVEEIGCMKKL